MAFPPPPPGPPPSMSRSQSVQPLDRSTVPVASPPTRRPPTLGSSALGPVPPTPADWVDDSNGNSNTNDGSSYTPSRAAQGLTIDTDIARNSDQVPDAQLSSTSNGGLNRTKAVRHDKTIVQRRAESKTRHSTRNSIDEMTHPHAIADIIVPGSQTSANRHSLQSGESSAQAEGSNVTPRNHSVTKLPRLDTGTSPYSGKQYNNAGPSSVAPKALPTPPPQTRSASSMKARENSRPPPFATTPISKHLVVTQSAEQFAAGAIERFQAFASLEAAATTDADRVRLFADFVVNESRVRRERYATAIGAMGSEIFDLTRDFFRPMVAERRPSVVASPDEWTPDSSGPVRSHRESMGSNPPDNGGSSSAPGSARLPPSPNTSGQSNANYNSNSNYMPSLSPILSMSVSDNHENGSSRGRPSSRWWEADSQGDGSRRFERSKRESKYMGVPKDQWADVEDPMTTPHIQTSDQGSSSDYPPEKTGWHDQDDATWTPQPSKFFHIPPGSTPSPAPRSQDFLDVSRLVTLPPPYPRHHPAVNNNHPELTETRISVRELSDMAEIKTAKEKFTAASSKRRDEAARAVTERQQGLRANLQREISSGHLSYADAAAIEADSQTQEIGTKKEFEKAEYELFQNEVIMPLNDLLTARITRATALYDGLARGLFDNGQNDADMPQEEGDDRPELLEKLTLLKWIFEARESLHRAIYDLLSERNERFRDVVITPYRLTGNTEKLKNAEAFFAEDSSKRECAFANEVLDRTRDFRGIMDNAVQRGVALQLSAFWDIAPPLSRLLESIPADLRGFNIQIPLSEFDENPSYRDHPMQYLLSLVLHTEKSAYQFIEAHTNLLCLLHEVKEAVVHAKAKVLASQTTDADGTPISPQQRDEMSRAMRDSEGRRLTDDLKEKVRVVQDQWSSALAENITNVKERASEWLLQTGGWDDTIMEGGGIGGP